MHIWHNWQPTKFAEVSTTFQTPEPSKLTTLSSLLCIITFMSLVHWAVPASQAAYSEWRTVMKHLCDSQFPCLCVLRGLGLQSFVPAASVEIWHRVWCFDINWLAREQSHTGFSDWLHCMRKNGFHILMPIAAVWLELELFACASRMQHPKTGSESIIRF